MDQAVRSYFDAVPETRQPHVMALHEAIIECFPDVSIDMRYRMPTYSYGEGWVAIANQKNYVSLYTCSASHLAKFKEKHPNYRTAEVSPFLEIPMALWRWSRHFSWGLPIHRQTH